MTNIPLDAPSGFTPSDEERPAGQWMEGYWAQTAPWAKRFGFAIWAYFGCLLFVQFQYLDSTRGVDVESRLFVHLGTLLLYSPIVALGYFCFLFGQNLERALVDQDQILLEKAFQQLHRFLIFGLVIVTLWLLSSVAQGYRTIQIMREYNSPNHIYEEPLRSE